MVLTIFPDLINLEKNSNIILYEKNFNLYSIIDCDNNLYQ